MEIADEEIVITLPVEKVYPGLKQQIEERLNHYPIKVIPVKRLSKAQNGLIHVLLKQFGEELGWTMQDMKEYQKEQFALSRDLEKFSTANCDMEMANDFIAFIIEQALENEINLYVLNKHDNRYKSILKVDKTTERYVIACLRKRVCCICGKEHNEYNEIQLDHYDTVANTVGIYENDDGLHGRFLPLCSYHHFEKHSKSLKEFEEKYHIEGVWLNPQLVYDLLPVYKNHFKKFKKEYREGKYGNLEKFR
nr:putative HNHc nuclease [uncultured Leptotrichia sp.]